MCAFKPPVKCVPKLMNHLPRRKVRVGVYLISVLLFLRVALVHLLVDEPYSRIPLPLKRVDEQSYCDTICTNSSIQSPQLANFNTGVRVLETLGKQGRIFYCIIRKVGSSNTLAWAERSRFYYSAGTHASKYEFDRARARKDEVYIEHPDVHGQTLVLVRNPYVRLASGWRHWVKSGRKYRYFENNFTGFVEYLRVLSENGTNWSNVDVHFRPQVEHCGLQHNTFAYELKLENPLRLTCTLYSLSGVCPLASSGNMVAGPFTGSGERNLAEIYSHQTCVVASRLYLQDFQRFQYNSSACI